MSDDERTRPARPVPQFRTTVVAPPRSSSTVTPAPERRYEAESALGQGGMGRVERGVDRFLGRSVALKRSLSDDPEMLEMLLREAEIAARLDHPSIVTIHDVCYASSGEPIVVMRLVDGKPLAELVSSTAPMTNLALLSRVLPAIEAVAFAHREGVIHRDLKPDNILVGDLGNTVVIDWGLALDLHAPSDPFAGAKVGTPGFMSPEQARGDKLDERTDVYALGITLFFVLAGRLPPELASYEVTGVTGTPPTSGERVWPSGTPRDLVTIVDKACAPDREARYRNAEELAAELQRFIGGQLVAAHDYSLAQRLARWVRRHRIAVAIAAFAVLVSTAIGVVAIRGVIVAGEAAERERLAAVTAEAHADARADQLLLDRAHAALVDDPARAIALLALRHAPNRDGPAWAIGVEASARGVPHASVAEGSLGLVAALGDGAVVTTLIDGAGGRLAIRDRDGSRVIATYPSRVGGLVDFPGGFAIANEDLVEQFDTHGNRTASWPDPGNRQVSAAAGWIVSYNGDSGIARKANSAQCPDGHGPACAPGLERTVEFAGAGAAVQAVDPSGTWWAMAGKAGLQIVDLASGGVRVLVTDPTLAVLWSADGARLLALVGDDTIEWTIADGDKHVWHTHAYAIAYLADRPMMRDRRGCARMLADRETEPFDCREQFAAIMSVRAGLVAVANGRTITLYDGWNTRHYAAPGVVSRVAIDPSGHELVATTPDGLVAVWELGAGGVRRYRIAGEAAALRDDDILVDENGSLIEIDREGARKKVAYLGYPMPGRALLVLDRAHAVVLDLNGELYSLESSQRYKASAGTEPGLALLRRPVAVGVVRVVVASDHEVGYVDGSGGVVIVDLDAPAHSITKQHAGPLAQLSADDGIGAIWRDGYIWWRDRAGGEHEAQAGCMPSEIRPRGQLVEVACDKELLEVSATGHRLIVKLPEPIDTWTSQAAVYAITTPAHAIWRFDGALTQLVAANGNAPGALAPVRFAIVDQVSGAVKVCDVASATCAVLGTIDSPNGVWISRDGRHVLALGRGEVLEWRDPLSADPAAWPAQLAALTNATLSEPGAALLWR